MLLNKKSNLCEQWLEATSGKSPLRGISVEGRNRVDTRYGQWWLCMFCGSENWPQSCRSETLIWKSMLADGLQSMRCREWSSTHLCLSLAYSCLLSFTRRDFHGELGVGLRRTGWGLIFIYLPTTETTTLITEILCNSSMPNYVRERAINLSVQEWKNISNSI